MKPNTRQLDIPFARPFPRPPKRPRFTLAKVADIATLIGLALFLWGLVMR